MFEQIIQTFFMMLSLTTILWTAAGVLLGILVGAMPGLTATMAVALLLSVTYGMSTVEALAVLIGVYLGGIYGGSRSAILMNVPGTPSSAATILDGFPLAQKGEPNRASLMATVTSAVGGLIGVVILAVAAPLVARGALEIKVWEYFWLAIFGVTICANLATGNMLKGLIAGMLGLLITTVGTDPVYGFVRLTFGIRPLVGTISIVPAMVGLFGLAQALDSLVYRKGTTSIATEVEKEPLWLLFYESLKSLIRTYWVVTVRSAVIGTFIGAVPGVGPDIASWVAYDTAKRRSKKSYEFGKGSYEGLLASETANNAATSGVFIPLLTLGIPGCAVSAVILGGMRLHGLRPGPVFFIDQPQYISIILAILILANIFIVIMGTAITPLLTKVVQVPTGVVMPVVVVFCVIGAYGISYRMFDITLMLFFGLLGFIMRRIDMPAAPMVLGIVLGSMAEGNFIRALLSFNSFAPFFTRPISLVLVLIILLTSVWSWIRKRIFQKNRFRKNGSK